MKRMRHTAEQIIRKLRGAEVLLGGGATNRRSDPGTGCKRADVSPLAQPVRREKADDARRLKQPEQENTRLRRLVADQALDLSILKEVARGNF